MKITDISAIQILDSRGFPTVETVVKSGNFVGRASVPSGASTGTKEAHELRDGDKNYCHGKGVLKAVRNINTTIKEAVIGMDAFDQMAIDDAMIELDGTKNKDSLGGNAILSVSLAVADLAANILNIPLYRYIGGITGKTLPCPMMNVINGGKHADNGLDIQEFMIMPVKFDTINEAIMASTEVFHNLKNILKHDGFQTNVGDEGGFAPNVNSTHETMDLLMKAIEKSNYIAGEDFLIALDCAASEFYNKETHRYDLKGENISITTDELILKYAELIKQYPIFSIEDPLSEFDFNGFQKMTKQLGKSVQIVGDDIFCTNPEILQHGINSNICNGLLVKPNQIGTMSECLEAVKIAQFNKYNAIISHRSGETEDCKISHIAVGTNAGQIKTGSLSRSDRTAKYNELLRIEAQNSKLEYNGHNILGQFQSFS